MDITDKLIDWINEYQGIFTFGTHTTLDESIFNCLSDYILNNKKLVKKSYTDVSYLKSFQLKESSFLFRSSDIMSGGENYQQDKQIIKTIADNCITNNNSVLLQVPVFQTGDGNFIMRNGAYNVMISSIMGCILSNGKLSIQKLRWDNSDDYDDIDILQFVRDYKLNLLIT